jgi:hypothetical protein
MAHNAGLFDGKCLPPDIFAHQSISLQLSYKVVP